MQRLSLKRIKKRNTMDRRTALKNLSIGVGYAVATPTILNILSSCTAEDSGWKPLFLSSEEKHIVTHLADIIEARDGEKGQFETLLASLFNLSDEATETLFKQQRHYSNTFTDSEKDNFMLYKFLISVRRYTLLGYFSSEKVGEEVLNYDPIPGQQLGCIPLKDVPNGRTWSFQRW